MLLPVRAQAEDADTTIVLPPVVDVALPAESDAAGATRLRLDPQLTAVDPVWQQAEQSAANFHVSDAGAGEYGSLFALRGVANTPYFSDPAITVYLADIPLPSSYAYPSAVMGFSALTLYRGPMGTEFGRATDGGVMVFSPVAANAASAGAGAYAERDGSVEMSQSSVLFAGGYAARNGYIENVQLGRRVDDQENESAYAQGSVGLGTQAKFTAEGFATRGRDGAQPLIPLGGPLFTVARAQEGETDLDSWGVAGRLDVTLPGGGTLRSVTSYTDWRMNPYANYLVLPPALKSSIIQDQKSWNEELHLGTGPQAPVKVDGGIWLSRSTTDNAVNRAIPGLFPIEVSEFELGSRTAAAFATAAVPLGDGWSVGAGARAEVTERDFARHEQVPVPNLGYSGVGRYGALLPRAELDWTGSAGTATAAIATGMRPGGFASYTDNPALIPFAAERMTSYTAGLSTPAGRTWDAAARVFYEAISNYQIERSYSASDYFVATAAKAEAHGAELEGRWHPAAGWSVGASAGWTTAILDRYRSPTTGADLSGKTAPYIPAYNANVEVAYRPATGWFAGVQLSAVGRTYYDELESSAYAQAAYALLGARAGYATAHWTVTVYGENLTDKGYYALIIPGVNSGSPGTPRTGGAEITVRW